MEEKEEILRCGEGGDLIRTQGEDGEEGGDCEGEVEKARLCS